MPAQKNHISNYYLLERLCRFLRTELAGSTLRGCYSINKNEVIFSFDSQRETLVCLKAFLGEQSFVFFPSEANLKAKNRMYPFPQLAGKMVTDIQAHPQDRSFRIEFADSLSLVFLLYGRNGNIVMFEEHNRAVPFKAKFEKHALLKLEDFTGIKPPDFDAYKNIATDSNWKEAIATLFPALTSAMLSDIGAEFVAHDVKCQWQMIFELEASLLNGDIYLAEDKEGGFSSGIRLLLARPETGEIKQYISVRDALNEYAQQYFYITRFNTVRNSALQSLEEQLKKAEQSLSSAQKHLDTLEKDKNYRMQADIIMANLHQIPTGTEKAELYDFYNDRQLKIKLKRGQTPQAWAEKLYQKAKSQEIEKDKTMERLIAAEQQVALLKEELVRISAAHDLKTLKGVIKESDVPGALPASPFKRFDIEGYEVYAGKSAENNDKLTFGFAHKEDMWLHARDVSGSHVIIRHRQKDVFPAAVLERAAEIAAYYSKSKQSSLCPVIYTLKKFVRKPKGAPAGAVIAEKEKVLLVEPGLPDQK